MILVDSDVLIAHLRGMPEARDWLIAARRRAVLAISVVSIAEIIGDMRSVERRRYGACSRPLRTEPVNELIARRAGELMRHYRRSHTGIGLGDYLIAATADTRGLSLATLNVRHFPMFKGIQPPFELT